MAVGPIALVPLGLWAGPFSTGGLVQVSGRSPFARCAADDVDTSNIVAFWQQERWSDGGSRGLVAGVSMDGGTSWTSVVVPAITSGMLHQISLAFGIDPPVDRPGGVGQHCS